MYFLFLLIESIVTRIFFTDIFQIYIQYILLNFDSLFNSYVAILKKTIKQSINNTISNTHKGQMVWIYKEFTILILVAFAVSAPVGWYFMHKWLQAYAYQVPLGPKIFILAIVASVAIAWLTVGYKAVRAALANPVKSLRSEWAMAFEEGLRSE